MTDRLNCIMLIDDNKFDNFYHERIIRMNNKADHIVSYESAIEALHYLKRHEPPHPDLIFLDINMPGMDGWEFLEEYNKLPADLQGKVIVVMLTTSENPDEKARALGVNTLAEFKTKPLTIEMLDEILEKYF